MHVQIVLFEGFDPLDVVAPFDVFGAGAAMLDDEVSVTLVAATGPGDVASGQDGLSLRAHSALDPELPGIVLIPGASGSVAAAPTDSSPDSGPDPDSIPGRLGRAAHGPLAPLLARALGHPEVTVATVCGGSHVLALAGLITGRRATGHTMSLDALAAAGVEVVRARVVDDGDLVSAGGVTSGLDLALYLLERFHGPMIALAVEGLFEYERRGTVWSATGRTPRAA